MVRIESEHEQAGRVGAGDDLAFVDQQGAARLERDATQPRRGRRRHGFRTQRRHVGTSLLTRLAALDQNASRPGQRHLAGARQHAVGALDRLHRQHRALLHHAGLADIDAAEGCQHLAAAGDVGERPLVRPLAAKRATPAGAAGQELMRAANREPLLAQHPHDRRQQSVIAGEEGAADPGQQPRALGVGPEVAQAGSLDGTDQDDVAALLGVQQRQDAARRRRTRPVMRERGDDLGVGEVGEGDDEDGAAGREDRPRDLGRQRAAAGQDADAVGGFAIQGSALDPLGAAPPDPRDLGLHPRRAGLRRGPGRVCRGRR